MNTQLSLSSYRAKLPTKKAALRELLSDMRWHTQQQMVAAAGYRYGAALFDLHNEADFASGRPVHYQKHVGESDGCRVRYRQVDAAACDICSNPKHLRPSERIAQLEARVAELEAENRVLRGGR